MTTSTLRLRIGSRAEALILLPSGLLLLVVLSLFVLFTYRGTVDQLLLARGEEATRLAHAVAAELDPEILPRPESLRRLTPQAWAVAVLDANDVPLVMSGTLPLAGAEPVPPGGALAWLIPPASAANVVAGTAPLPGPGRAARVRVDLPAVVLRARARALRVLSPLVLVADAAVTVLLLLYLRRVLVPLDRLVERARSIAPASGTPEEDEIALLLQTFDRALVALAAPADATRDAEDLAAVERALARSLESGVLLCDRDGMVLALNEFGARLLTIPVPPAGEIGIDRVLAPHPALRDLLDDVIRDERAVRRRELEVETGDGARALGLTAHPLRRDDGSVRGYLVLFADLTAARRQAEQERLAENLTQVGALAAGVAHEMRNSLATLRGYLELIEREASRDAIFDFFGEIRRESDHLARVLDDFLSFARPGSVRPEDVDLARLAARCAADPALGGMAVRVRGPDAPAVVRADAQLLERALKNLVLNAAQAQREIGVETPIEISILTRRTAAELLVEDRGPGLPAAVAESLFQPFASGRPDGVGLGLALARRIVVLHGGQLTLERRSSGGTRARVLLPQPLADESDDDGKFVTDGNDPDAGSISPGPGSSTGKPF